ncbi:siroheme synthase CysG [Simiduia agarivorans]|uniref:Siroheme synthase n=1 Tax=Simiduia agarivorans (strain DSM 21679 / JCM 13881 / BCRC 17597 / SA1) TaxID=1117647 RepID=K4KFV2_SIMAS|nr:siroheme synthase CysG [Simiduia agarivorans]AFU97826.1 siroheme synthase [Simiduia agarivorans SA1 = DSM 21679]
MEYFPFFFDLKRKPVLLVGAGSVGLRKARLLVSAGAHIRCVAPDAVAELQALLQQNDGQWTARGFAENDLDGVHLVICATADRALNDRIASLCQARFLPVNVVDDPALCSIITPAIVDRSPILVAISSGGAAPVIARKIKQMLEVQLPEATGKLAQFCRSLRDRVKQRLPEARRRYFWEALIEGRAAQWVASDQRDLAEVEVERLLSEQAQSSAGEVYLVGAGPGAPDLLTIRALQLMQRADVVLYDRLVSEPILDKVRRDADRIYVGKRRADHAVPQQEINQLLLDLAQQGKRVLRLKGGDPFIFGRGGEEIALLAQHQIPFEVVPGITAASGCSAYAGIPLTHRDFAQSVRFITGHLQGDAPHVQWSEYVREDQTLVFYMSLQGLPTICDGLIAHGRPEETPAALVERGTTPDQRVHRGTLKTLPGIAQSAGVQAPTLLIIGGVVSLAESLAWYRPTR